MVQTESTMLELGTEAPDFALPDTEGRTVTPDDLPIRHGLLVAFICNHCPFVLHLREELARLGHECAERGVAMVAISANNPETHPADSPEKMAEEKANAGYPFPYLFDGEQRVAQAYRAACTPDFFLFDAQRKLYYRGRFDESTPKNGRPITGTDLYGALEAMLRGDPPPQPQYPSIGCNIKWKAGNEPDY
ncbi:thioredoxin family protein [Halorhodospira abdelmalekii]|uniref:thioredoxin family protein n=1 Tax=Halorhodospira abdelmalekii TaxID=421629 RepID=UPI0019048635|nr:thioredoxin family protein [Halorhodospira abdelmalekii]MBK1734450.1 thioredoxin family protein [Halorhodospira abdelmalekii]